MGMNVSATASEASRAKVTVRAWSVKIWPATPSMNTMGKNTAMVVRVEAVTAMPTSDAPRRADSTMESPSSRHRNMLSSTTMALSTSMPMPRASPPSDMMLSVVSLKNIRMKVISTDTGMATPTIKVLLRLRRNRKRTRIASRPPHWAVLITSSMAFSMKRDWSDTMYSETPSGRVETTVRLPSATGGPVVSVPSVAVSSFPSPLAGPVSSASPSSSLLVPTSPRRSLIARATVTVFASASLNRAISTLSCPLIRVTVFLSL